MKNLNTTLRVNDKVITILHDDMVFIADATSYPYGIPAAIYTSDIPDDIDAYDLTDGNRYYAYYKDVDVIEAIDDIVYNQCLVRVKTWDAGCEGFEGMDGLHYDYIKNDPDDMLVESSGAERIMPIKEVYCNGDTGELCAYLVCERK